MPAKKTDTLTIRLDPAVKEVLRKTADEERRSIANMVEVMILRYADGALTHMKVIGTSTNRGASPKISTDRKKH